LYKPFAMCDEKSLLLRIEKTTLIYISSFSFKVKLLVTDNSRDANPLLNGWNEIILFNFIFKILSIHIY